MYKYGTSGPQQELSHTRVVPNGNMPFSFLFSHIIFVFGTSGPQHELSYIRVGPTGNVANPNAFVPNVPNVPNVWPANPRPGYEDGDVFRPELDGLDGADDANR